MIPTDTRVYEVLYVSTLTERQPLSAVAEISAKARVRNAEKNITGILIFDGMRFCQQMEGRQKDVLSLIERIRVDARHTDVEIFYHGPLAQRRFKNFTLAFANAEDENALAALALLDGKPGLNGFLSLLDTLTLQG